MKSVSWEIYRHEERVSCKVRHTARKMQTARF
jgi:hypothetical protein